MVDLKAYGSAAAAGEYICADCSHVLSLESGGILPRCPRRGREEHSKRGWRPLYGRATVGRDPLPAGVRG